MANSHASHLFAVLLDADRANRAECNALREMFTLYDMLNWSEIYGELETT
jgi:hypothetical protein